MIARGAVLLGLALLGACSSTVSSPDDAQACALYSQQAQRVETDVDGTVVAVLGTRRGPSGEHTGFLLHLHGVCALTLRIETNVDITGPIPVARGERAEVKGEYIYDPRGGLVHWTHHDPRGRHAGGYVLIDGKTYE